MKTMMRRWDFIAGVRLEKTSSNRITLGLDVAASYDFENSCYRLQGKRVSAEELSACSCKPDPNLYDQLD